MLRLNTDLDPSSGVSIFFSSTPSIRPTVSFTCDGRSIASSDVGVAWFHQPPPSASASASSSAANFQRSTSFLAAWMGALSLLRCRWLNHPLSVLHGSNKALQLDAALRAGLHVPATLVSSIPTDVRQFATEHGPLVAKNLATPWHDVDGRIMAAYTVPFTSATDQAIRFAPVIYQRFRPRCRDYRVVVVGREVFVVAAPATDERRFDCRKGPIDTDSYAAADLPASIVDGLLRMLKYLRLEHCSADFIEAEDGQIYFLDLNTTGSWWWVDRVLSGAVCKAFVRELVQPR